MKDSRPLSEAVRLFVPGVNAVILLGAVLYSSNALAAQCQMQSCTIVGTEVNDLLVGTSGDDVICGLAGDDKIEGGGGNDLICGGPGDDRIHGGTGINMLVGGIGDDEIRSTSKYDTVFGNQGANKIFTRFEETWVTLGSGDESVFKAGREYKIEDVKKDQQNKGGSRTRSATGKNSHTLEMVSRSAVVSDPLLPFSTDNNRIYAPDGAEFIPRGVNIFPWALGEHNKSGIADCWNFNLVRLHSWILPSMTSPWKDHLVYIDEPLLFDDTEERFRTYDIAPLIEAYTSQEIVVIIDIHDIIGDYFTGDNLAMYLQFVEDLARKYKDNPYVWLDVHNEPGSWEGQSGDFSEWRTEIPLILDTVRAIAPNMILIAGGTAWGQDTGPSWWDGDVVPEQSALLSNMDIIQGYDNLLVTFHMYDQWKFSYDRVKNFVDKLLHASDAPIFVGEYGSWNGSSTLPASQYLHALVKEPGYERIGRSVWTWSAWDNNDLVDSGDGSGYWVDSCETPTNLSPLGDLVWKDNHSNN